MDAGGLWSNHHWLSSECQSHNPRGNRWCAAWSLLQALWRIRRYYLCYRMKEKGKGCVKMKWQCPKAKWKMLKRASHLARTIRWARSGFGHPMMFRSGTKCQPTFLLRSKHPFGVDEARVFELTGAEWVHVSVSMEGP